MPLESVDAPLPGKVLSVNFKPGDNITEGGEICIIEAMKMENPIVSPMSGVVKEISISPEQTVKAGETIAVIVKKFLPFGSIITFISVWLGPFPKRIPISTKRRFAQELNGLKALRSSAINAPEVYFRDNKEKLILMEHISGVDIGGILEKVEGEAQISRDRLNLFHDCGRELAFLHKKGVSLVSHNDRSRIVEKRSGKIYFVDFELSTKADYRAWDAAIFIHWMRIKLGFAERNKADNLESAFINGYKGILPLPETLLHNRIKDLRIYASFAKLGMRINRRRKAGLSKGRR